MREFISVSDDPSQQPEVTRSLGDGSNHPMSAALALTPASCSIDELVLAAREGERSAFDELVRRTHADTYALARRLVSDADDAMDVTQEAYLRAFRSIPRFRGDAQFTTWLYRITANCASTYLGRRRRHQHDVLEDEHPLTDTCADNDPEAAADADDLRARLEAAVAGLPPKLRAVVVLKDVYDFSHSEIADELGISESAAKVRLHRARHRLRMQVFPWPGERAEEGSSDEV